MKQTVLKKLVNGALKSFGYLPMGMAQAVGWCAGQLFLLVPGNEMKRITRLNIDRCFPERSVAERRKLTRRSVVHTIITGFEMPRLFTANPGRLLKDIRHVDGHKQVQEAFETGESVLFLGPHFGAWELCGLYLAEHFPVYTLYSAPKIKVFDELIKKARSRSGAHMAEATNRGVMEMFKALRRKQAVAMLSDQVPDFASGVYVSFCQAPALTMRLAGKMYRKCKPSTHVAYVSRRGIGRGFNCHFMDVQPYLESVRKNNPWFDDEQVHAQAMNACFEQVMLSAPEQYEWSYKRFKHHPAVMLDPYRREQPIA